MPNRNGVPFDLKSAEVRTRKTDTSNPFLRKMLLRQGTSRSSRHHFCPLKACGVRSRNTKGGIYEIAVFTMVTDDFQFTRDSEDFRNKVPVGELEICIALRIA